MTFTGRYVLSAYVLLLLHNQLKMESA